MTGTVVGAVVCPTNPHLLSSIRDSGGALLKLACREEKSEVFSKINWSMSS